MNAEDMDRMERAAIHIEQLSRVLMALVLSAPGGQAVIDRSALMAVGPGDRLETHYDASKDQTILRVVQR